MVRFVVLFSDFFFVYRAMNSVLEIPTLREKSQKEDKRRRAAIKAGKAIAKHRERHASASGFLQTVKLLLREPELADKYGVHVRLGRRSGVRTVILDGGAIDALYEDVYGEKKEKIDVPQPEQHSHDDCLDVSSGVSLIVSDSLPSPSSSPSPSPSPMSSSVVSDEFRCESGVVADSGVEYKWCPPSPCLFCSHSDCVCKSEADTQPVFIQPSLGDTQPVFIPPSPVNDCGDADFDIDSYYCADCGGCGTSCSCIFSFDDSIFSRLFN